MFDPEHLGIRCTICGQGDLYHDREIGCYCIRCGQRFTSENMNLLVPGAESEAKRHVSGCPVDATTPGRQVVRVKACSSPSSDDCRDRIAVEQALLAMETLHR